MCVCGIKKSSLKKKCFLEEDFSKYVLCVCSSVYWRVNAEICDFFGNLVQAVSARTEQSSETRCK